MVVVVVVPVVGVKMVVVEIVVVAEILIVISVPITRRDYEEIYIDTEATESYSYIFGKPIK